MAADQGNRLSRRDTLKTAFGLGALMTLAGCMPSKAEAGGTPSQTPAVVVTPGKKELWSLTPEQLATAQRLDAIQDIGVFNNETLETRGVWLSWMLADLSKNGKYPADLFNQVANPETGETISAYNPWDKMLDKNATGAEIRAALVHNDALIQGFKTDMSTTVPEALNVLVAEKLTSVFHMNHQGATYKSLMDRLPKQGNAKAIDAAKSVKDTVTNTTQDIYKDPQTGKSYDAATIGLKTIDGVTFNISSVFIDLSDVLGTTSEGSPAGVWVDNE